MIALTTNSPLCLLLLTYFGLRVQHSLGIRRPNLVFLPFRRSRSVSRLYFKKSPVRHLTKEFEFGAFKLAFMISFFLTKIKQSLLEEELHHCLVVTSVLLSDSWEKYRNLGKDFV